MNPPRASGASRPPVVSVVMIFLDAARFMREAVESVLGQRYQSWELLLVDDGSVDGSSAIARAYAAAHPDRVFYQEHEGHRNLGMSASRNAGLRAARGALVAFLDADDVWRPEKLERQVALLERHPSAAMVYGATEHWFSWAGASAGSHRDVTRKLGVPGDTLVAPPTLLPLFLSDAAQTPGMCGILVRRDVATRVGGFDERFRGMYEDQVFLYKICLHAPVFVEGGSWDRYRQHPQSHSAIARASGAYRHRRPSPATRAFLQWLDAYLTQHGVTDAAVRRPLARALRPYGNPLLYHLLVAREWARQRWAHAGRRRG